MIQLPGQGQHIIKTWDVVINEIMADPDPVAGSIPYPEYVELYNRRNFPISIQNWKMCVGTTCKQLPAILIPADSFLVITGLSGVSFFSADVNVCGISGFPALSNTGQTLQLQNESGNVIAVVSYSDNWYGDPLTKEGGYSLEQIDAANPCAEKENWKASVNGNGGTPGKKNSIKTIQPDTRPPEVLRVNVVSSEQLEVFFTEALDSATLEDPLAYDITTIGNPVRVKLVKPAYKSVFLTLPTPLMESVVYVLRIKGSITDCVGNQIDKNTSARFAVPSVVSEKDIVINEVLFDPYAGGVDFVEVYNRSQKVLDLKSLFLAHFDTINQSASEIEKITSSGYLFFPGEYLVLSEQEEKVKKQYNTTNARAFLNVPKLPSLNAGEGSICLKTTTAIIDNFSYNARMHFALLTAVKGISLERVHFDRSSNDVTNWHSASSSVGFATPGYQNSEFAEGIETDETVKIDPEIFSPDEDGINDMVSIYFHLGTPGWSASILVFDSNGRLVRTLLNNQLVGTDGVYSWDGINNNREKEQTGIYIIYLKVFNLSGMIKQYKKVCVLNVKN